MKPRAHDADRSPALWQILLAESDEWSGCYTLRNVFTGRRVRLLAAPEGWRAVGERPASSGTEHRLTALSCDCRDFRQRRQAEWSFCWHLSALRALRDWLDGYREAKPRLRVTPPTGAFPPTARPCQQRRAVLSSLPASCCAARPRTADAYLRNTLPHGRDG